MSDDWIHWVLGAAITLLTGVITVIASLGNWIFKRILKDVEMRATAENLNNHLEDDTGRFEQISQAVDQRHRENKEFLREIQEAIRENAREAKEDRKAIGQAILSLTSDVSGLKSRDRRSS